MDILNLILETANKTDKPWWSMANASTTAVIISLVALILSIYNTLYNTVFKPKRTNKSTCMIFYIYLRNERKNLIKQKRFLENLLKNSQFDENKYNLNKPNIKLINVAIEYISSPITLIDLKNYRKELSILLESHHENLTAKGITYTSALLLSIDNAIIISENFPKNFENLFASDNSTDETEIREKIKDIQMTVARYCTLLTNIETPPKHSRKLDDTLRQINLLDKAEDFFEYCNDKKFR